MTENMENTGKPLHTAKLKKIEMTENMENKGKPLHTAKLKKN